MCVSSLSWCICNFFFFFIKHQIKRDWRAFIDIFCVYIGICFYLLMIVGFKLILVEYEYILMYIEFAISIIIFYESVKKKSLLLFQFQLVESIKRGRKRKNDFFFLKQNVSIVLAYFCFLSFLCEFVWIKLVCDQYWEKVTMNVHIHTQTHTHIHMCTFHWNGDNGTSTAQTINIHLSTHTKII